MLIVNVLNASFKELPPKEIIHQSYKKFNIENFHSDLLEVIVQSCSVKKVFLEISENYRKPPVPESIF